MAGNDVRTTRLAAGLSIKQMADMIGLPPMLIALNERDPRTLTPKELRKLRETHRVYARVIERLTADVKTMTNDPVH